MEIYNFDKHKKLMTFVASDNQKYAIGSKLFPVANKKKISFWCEANTQEIEKHVGLAYAIDNVQGHVFKTGKCFRNAKVMCELGQIVGLDIKFYAGWLFGNHPVPVFHAWNVLNDNIIIDSSIHTTTLNQQNRLRQMENESKLEGLSQDEVREIYIKIIEEEKKKSNGKMSEEILYGKVPQNYIYFGAEDTHSASQERFRKAYESVKLHPAYHHRRDKKTGESIIQQRLKERGLF